MRPAVNSQERDDPAKRNVRCGVKREGASTGGPERRQRDFFQREPHARANRSRRSLTPGRLYATPKRSFGDSVVAATPRFIGLTALSECVGTPDDRL